MLLFCLNTKILIQSDVLTPVLLGQHSLTQEQIPLLDIPCHKCLCFFCIVVRYDQGMIRATTGKNKRPQKDFVCANSGTFVVSDDMYGILRKAITEQE